MNDANTPTSSDPPAPVSQPESPAETVRDDELAELIRRHGRALMQANLKLSDIFDVVKRLAERPSSAPSVASSVIEWVGFDLLADFADGIERAIASLHAVAHTIGTTEVATPATPKRRRRWWSWPFQRKRKIETPPALDVRAWQTAIEASIDGLNGLKQRALSVLHDHGYEPVRIDGTFDPTMHQAIAVEPGPPGEIVRTVRLGFYRNDTVFRPALVIVGQSPPSQPFHPPSRSHPTD